MTDRYLLNHNWRTRLDKAAAFITPATFFLLRTRVVYPAIMGMLFLLLMCKGNIGDWVLKGAEERVRDAPAGQVWAFESPAIPDRVLLVSVTAVAECNRQAVPRSVWVDEANRSLVLLYKTGVLISLIASVLTWLIRHRASAC